MARTAKPTAGPLELHRGDDYLEVRQVPSELGGRHRKVYQVRYPDAEDVANAEFFIAAHGMAEALELIIEACQTKEYREPLTHAQISDIARAALPKAGV